MKRVLVLNAGSSSLKFALYSVEPTLSDTPTLSGQIDGIGASPRLSAKMRDGKRFDEEVPIEGDHDLDSEHKVALTFLFDWLNTNAPHISIVAAGHRVVHGGEAYSAPIVIDSELLHTLDTFVPLAPLHQPHNLRAIRMLQQLMPDIPQVACFDTAFHRTNPPVAQEFAIPRSLTAEGVKRYGFHGLSYEFVARQLALQAGEDKARGRVIIAHLGNGASMCALLDGKSTASTMGFTAVDGLMMGTRTGNLDPGVLLYLIQHKDWDLGRLTRLIYKESGLLGVSGISQDMRVLLASDAPEAEEAVELFCYRIIREIGSLAATIGGLDTLVFTGGIGEHADAVRQRVVAGSGWLGAKLDPAANADHASVVSAADSRIEVRVIPTNEEWMIAHHTVELLHL